MMCGYYGGGSRGGGCLWTPRYHGPLGWLSKRRQGGPWAPPPCSENSLGNMLGSVPGLLFLALQVVVCFNVQSLFFSGVGVFSGTLSPSRPDPCLVFICLCPPSSLCLVCSSTQALGKPKPLEGGLGFPLCFFVLLAHSAFDPYFVVDTYTTAKPSPCFCFLFFVFLSPSLVFQFGWFLGFVLVVLGFLVVSLVLVLVVLAC